MSEELPYNPLDIPSVALSLALEILEQPLCDIPPDVRFPGAGVYVLYYTGDFDVYRPLWTETKSGRNPKIPIYVGKAERKGKRKGFTFTPIHDGALHRRLQSHANSIKLASNLNVSDFSCRYRVIEETFIGLAESALVSVYCPVWNVVLDGFGNNPTGGPRSSQKQSNWDTLHPGRGRGLGVSDQTIDNLRNRVDVHLTSVAPAESADKKVEAIKDRLRKYGLG
jgi:hypothetical protein